MAVEACNGHSSEGRKLVAGSQRLVTPHKGLGTHARLVGANAGCKRWVAGRAKHRVARFIKLHKPAAIGTRVTDNY